MARPRAKSNNDAVVHCPICGNTKADVVAVFPNKKAVVLYCQQPIEYESGWDKCGWQWVMMADPCSCSSRMFKLIVGEGTKGVPVARCDFCGEYRRMADGPSRIFPPVFPPDEDDDSGDSIII